MKQTNINSYNFDTLFVFILTCDRYNIMTFYILLLGTVKNYKQLEQDNNIFMALHKTEETDKR